MGLKEEKKTKNAPLSKNPHFFHSWPRVDGSDWSNGTEIDFPSE